MTRSNGGPRCHRPPADIGAGEVSAGRRAQRLADLHGADNLSANAPEPEQSGDTPVLVNGTGAHTSPSQEGTWRQNVSAQIK